MPKRHAVDHPEPRLPVYVPPILPPQTPDETPHPDKTKRTSRKHGQRELLLPGVDDGPRAVAYGEQKLAGKLQFAHYRQAQDEMWLAIELCAGECDALLGVEYTDGRLAPLTGYVWNYWWYPGTAAGVVNPNFKAVLPTWNESFGAPPGSDTGTCNVIVQLKQFSRFWKATIPQDFLYHMRTRKPLSPATGLYTYSTSFWDQWYDWCRWSEGKALPSTRVDAASFVAAKAADVAAGRKHDSHLLLMDRTSPDDVVDTFRLMARAYWFWDATKYRVVADRPATSIATLDDDDVSLSSSSELDCIYDVFDRANKFTIHYTDTANGWQQKPYSYPESDPVGEEIIEEEHSLPHLHDRGQVKTLAMYLWYSRVFDARLRETWMGWNDTIKLGDVVTRFVEQRGLVIPFRYVKRTLKGNQYVATLHEYNVDKYAEFALTDPPLLESVLPDPSAAAPPVKTATVTSTWAESLYQLQDDSWRPKASFTIDVDPFAFLDQSIAVYVSVNGGAAKFWFNGAIGENYTPVLWETGNYALTLKTRNRITQEETAADVSLVVQGVTVTPPEAVEVVLNETIVDGNLTAATLYWGAAQSLAKPLFASGYWSNQGGLLTSFDAAKVNDGSTSAACFGTTTDSILRFHDAGGRRFTQLEVTADSNYLFVSVRHSPDSSSWTNTTKEYAPAVVSLGGGKYRLTYRWFDVGASEAYWEFKFVTAGVTVYDVQPAVRAGEFAQAASYRLYGGDDTLVCPPFPKGARPTAANPLDVFPFGITGTHTNWNGSGGGFTRFRLTTVNAAGVESAGIEEDTMSVWLPASAGTVIKEVMPQNAPAAIELSATAADNVDVPLVNGPGPIAFTVASGIGAAVHGLLQMVGACFPFVNRTGGSLVFKNQSATDTVTANRLAPQGAADLAVGDGEGGWIIYDDHAGANRWRVFSVSVASSLAGYAPLASPAFTGNPTGPTPASADNDTSLATTAFVRTAIALYAPAAAVTSVNGFTGAVALGVADITGAAPLASPAFTGSPTAPTQATSDNSTNIATTAFVKALAYAPLASPAFTGNPTGPTPATADNDTSLATTAFVRSAISTYAPVFSVAGYTGTVVLGVADVSGAAPLASPAFTGNPTGPTPATADNDTSLATTAFVRSAIATYAPVLSVAGLTGTIATIPWSAISSTPTTLSGYGITNGAPLASPAFTGTPTAPTASIGTNTTQLATCAFVLANQASVPAYSDVAFSAGNFVPAGGTSPTWVVGSSDQLAFYYAYSSAAKRLEMHCTIDNSTISGSPTELRVTIPAGYTVAEEVEGTGTYAPGSAEEGCRVYATTSTTYVSIKRLGGAAFATGTNNAAVRFNIVIRTTT